MRTPGMLAALVSVLVARLLVSVSGQSSRPADVQSAPPQVSAPPDIQIQLGDLLAAEARFRDAVDAYQRAVAAAAADPALKHRAQAGLALMLLRIGDFDAARVQAEQLAKTDGGDAATLALCGDTLWAFGLFEEAERAYDRAISLDATEARAHHGRARALAARSRLDEGMA